MAKKKITDLQLRSSVTDDCNFPVDDGIQSYRVTSVQIKTYILSALSIATGMIQDTAVTLGKLAGPVQESLLPTGTLLAFGGTAAPSGFLLADGTAISRTTYAALFALIGTTYGAGNGTTTFNLPDTRGVFIRGNGSQTIGGKVYTGTRGTTEQDQFQGHWHLAGNGLGGTNSGGGQPFTGTGNNSGVGAPAGDGVNGAPRTGSETRPANISVVYIIKT